METVKLYYNDSFLTEFTATVLTCEETKGGWLITLDESAFYPEGGGQAADHGTLGDARVTDTQEKDGVIFHTCDKPLAVGEKVTGKIDWARRFDHMQQHSGEHIVSGMICEAFHCDNTGFHMGADSVVIDYNTDITWEQILEIERRANDYIYGDHPFRAWYPDAEELKALPYRSKKELTGAVRITAFPGADMCACCGTHVKSSGQVGIAKFLSCQKFKDGVRLEVKFGKRAYDYLSRIWEQNQAVGRQLSAKAEDTAHAVERLKAESEEKSRRIAEMEESIFASIAEENRGKGNVLLLRGDMDPNSVRRLCVAVGEVCGGRAAVFAGSEESYKYALMEEGGDLRALTKDMNAALNGRGGGKPFFVQGSVAADEAAIRGFFEGK